MTDDRGQKSEGREPDERRVSGVRFQVSERGEQKTEALDCGLDVQSAESRAHGAEDRIKKWEVGMRPPARKGHRGLRPGGKGEKKEGEKLGR